MLIINASKTLLANNAQGHSSGRRVRVLVFLIAAQLIGSEEQHVLARPPWLSISIASYQIASLSTKTYVVPQYHALLAQSHTYSGLCSCTYTTKYI
jgi:hypothetical protein